MDGRDREFRTAFDRVRRRGGLGGGVPALHVHDCLPSTNQWLWELERAGPLPDGTTAIALRQTAGRGQWGRQWQSPAGGLYLSWFTRTRAPADDAPQLTLCAIWGIATALRDRGVPVLIKWPNDLLLDGRKLGGILTETRLGTGGATAQIDRAVVGVGLNWRNGVPETGISLQQWRDRHGPIDGLDTLAEVAALVWFGLWLGYDRWEREGIHGFLADYLELLACGGRPVTVGGRTGIAIGVSSRGELRVRFPDHDATESFPPGSLSLGYGRSPSGVVTASTE